MAIEQSKLKSILQYGSKEGNDVSILIDCQTVVEKKDYVATGLLTYVLGDIIEIEIPQYSLFELGDKVKATVYTNNGMFVFESTVVAKDTGSLIIINPPENKRKFTEKREYARVDTKNQGFLYELHDVMTKKKQAFEKPIDFAINNISLSGIGMTFGYDLSISKKSRLHLELDLGTKIPCVTEVIRKDYVEDGHYYGVQFTNLSKEHTNSLRAFILRNQIEAYFVQKKIDMHQRAIEGKKSSANM